MKKRVFAILMATTMIFSLADCGNSSGAEVSEQIEEANVEHVVENIERIQVETEEGGAVEKIEEFQHQFNFDVEGIQKETVPEEEDTTETIPEPEWILAYQDLLESNFISDSREGLQGFSLYDVDIDGTPELIVNIVHSYYLIYSYDAGSVELRSVLNFDSLSNEQMGYDTRDGKTYIYFADYGTGSDITTILYEFLLPTEEINGSENSGNVPWKEIYSAVYGDIESEGGSSITTIEWENAITNEKSIISKDEFMVIVDSFIPFAYVDLTNENIEKYCSRDYKYVLAQQSFEDRIDDKIGYRVISDSNLIVEDVNNMFTDEQIENLVSGMEEMEQMEMTNITVHVNSRIEYFDKVDGVGIVSYENNGGLPFVSIIFECDQGVFEGFVDISSAYYAAYIA